MNRFINRHLVMILNVISILVALIQAYGTRDVIFQIDGISYLDISDFILDGKWNQVVNSHWSPLYPACLAGARGLLHSNAFTEPGIAKVTNVVIFLVLLTAFNNFLRSFLKDLASRRDAQFLEMTSEAVTVVLFCWFWWTSLVLDAVFMDTPDQLAYASLLLAAALRLRFEQAKPSLAQAAILGLTLGLGYLAKSVVLPVSLAIFFTMLFGKRGLREKLVPVAVSVATFSCLALPWIGLISQKVGHITMSDSGAWNYGLFVEHASSGARPSGPVFTHPPRIMSVRPTAMEFATPIGGTYPLWLDPIYWHEGMHFKLSEKVIPMIKINLFFYACLLGFASFVYPIQWSGIPTARQLENLKRLWFFWMPAFVGMSGYVFVINLFIFGGSRYSSPFALLLVASIVGSVRIKPDKLAGKRMALAVLLLVLFPLLDELQELATDVTLALQKPAYRSYEIARALNNLGIVPGSKVAILGYENIQGFYRPVPGCPLFELPQQQWYYWARLARVKIVAQIMNEKAPLLREREFIAATDQEKADLYRKLANIGVTAIVYNPANRFDLVIAGSRQQPKDLIHPIDSLASRLPGDWYQLGNLECYVHKLAL